MLQSPDDQGLEVKAHELLSRLTDMAGTATVAVAFSGGADSALALAAAARAVGVGRVLAITAVSAAVDPEELSAAGRVAAELGVRHLTPDSDELQRPGYVENSPARCFHCKTEVISVVTATARQAVAGEVVVVTGTNADDLGALHRPGISAAERLGALTPLAGLSKADVRAISRFWGLSTWDKPAQPCLASRIAYGVPVVPTALGRVRQAEGNLRSLAAERGWAIRDLRVRDQGNDHATIEVDVDAVATWSADPAVIARVVATGFVTAEVDAQGFRSGSLNEVLARVAP